MKDPESRRAIQEQIRIQEELKKKILRDDQKGESDDEDDEDDEEGDQSYLDEETREHEASLSSGPKGLFAMKFMQRAMEAEKHKYDELLEEQEKNFQKLIGNDTEGQTSTPSGRRSYGGKQQSSTGNSILSAVPNGSDSMSSSSSSVSESSDRRDGRRNTITASNAIIQNALKEEAAALSKSNPWLRPVGSSVEKTSAKTARNDKQDDKKPKEKKKNKKESKNERGATDQLEINPDDVLSVRESEENGSSGQFLLSSQRSIVEEAFASVDVEKEFELEKKAIIDAHEKRKLSKVKQDAETLPGWGSWTGEGLRGTKRRSNKKPPRSKRTDDKKKHLILKQGVQVIDKRFLADVIPYEYGSGVDGVRLYEMQIRQPIGKDWNTRMQHERMSQPRVQARMGVAIEPLSRPVVPEDLSIRSQRVKKVSVGLFEETKKRVPKNLSRSQSSV